MQHQRVQDHRALLRATLREKQDETCTSLPLPLRFIFLSLHVLKQKGHIHVTRDPRDLVKRHDGGVDDTERRREIGRAGLVLRIDGEYAAKMRLWILADADRPLEVVTPCGVVTPVPLSDVSPVVDDHFRRIVLLSGTAQNLVDLPVGLLALLRAVQGKLAAAALPVACGIRTAPF